MTAFYCLVGRGDPPHMLMAMYSIENPTTYTRCMIGYKTSQKPDSSTAGMYRYKICLCMIDTNKTNPVSQGKYNTYADAKAISQVNTKREMLGR